MCMVQFMAMFLESHMTKDEETNEGMYTILFRHLRHLRHAWTKANGVKDAGGRKSVKIPTLAKLMSTLEDDPAQLEEAPGAES